MSPLRDLEAAVLAVSGYKITNTYVDFHSSHRHKKQSVQVKIQTTRRRRWPQTNSHSGGTHRHEQNMHRCCVRTLYQNNKHDKI